ncbi:MAG: IS110 family transposase [Desulfobacter postgatei]|uniref:IS110 family transposase n=1 Tax=Desulfobacter postgatei TaxID=2293 RepID=UPI0023F52A5B|nr:IS110 family transposase [Desulfobacter postgatei]MDD4274305.1 IS110 family transposase [Desulfobacter postgatei]
MEEKSNEEEKQNYEKEFKRIARKHPEIKNQKSLPGIGDIHAVKIVARVVTPWRFANKGHYLSYAGLIKLEKVSGGKSYGKKNSRYCRQLKNVYKMGVMAAIGGNNPINDYYEHLMMDKGYPPYQARHKACRRLATLSFGILKSGEKYQPYRKDYIKNNS